MTQPSIPLAQDAAWKRQTGHDGMDPIYSSTNIKCRLTFKARTVRTKEGDEIACQALMVCEEAVGAGDVISYKGKDYPVLGTVEEYPDLDGKVWWREVAL